MYKKLFLSILLISSFAQYIFSKPEEIKKIKLDNDDVDYKDQEKMVAPTEEIKKIELENDDVDYKDQEKTVAKTDEKKSIDDSSMAEEEIIDDMPDFNNMNPEELEKMIAEMTPEQQEEFLNTIQKMYEEMSPEEKAKFDAEVQAEASKALAA